MSRRPAKLVFRCSARILSLPLLLDARRFMRLPPLNALRAFEAAARNSSVHKAARELHVTPAAVSHQIKALEEFLGIMLFKRSPRRITLTPRSEEHTSELQSLMRISYAVFCLKKKMRLNTALTTIHTEHRTPS